MDMHGEVLGAEPNADHLDPWVLLVDDDPVVRNLLSAGLLKAGYRVKACAEAGGALESYRESTPDVAVLDIGLPDMPGTDLARELLRHDYRPILVLSSHDDMHIVDQAIDAGVMGYLVKPLSVAQLIPSLETTLAHFRRRRESIASHLDEGLSVGDLSQVMDRFPFALVIVDDHHRPIYRNAYARDLLSAKVLNLDSAGRLRSRSNSEGLVAVINQALGHAAAHTSAVLLDRHPDRRLHAWAAPLQPRRQSGAEPLAAVAVFDTSRGSSYTWDALKALYSLTRKETKLVNGLLNGHSLEDYCSHNFITANTVRTHLKSIYRKTGTNRQAEVVRLFSGMFVPAAD